MIDLFQLFDNYADANSSAVAVRYKSSIITYGDLKTRSQELANKIANIRVESRKVVAIDCYETPCMIIAVLGVLRSGNTCLPISPVYPPERIRFILNESKAKIMLTADSGKVNISQIHSNGEADQPIEVQSASKGYSQLNNTALTASCNNNSAYILYTSGSTGTPKGVSMGYDALSSLIRWQLAQDIDCRGLPTAQFAPLTFDVAFQEILSTLCDGGTLVLVPNEIRQDPAALVEFLREESIGRLFLPTAALQLVADYGRGVASLPALRHVYVAGEQLRITTQIRQWFQLLSHCTLHNHYGPTETHVVTSFTLSGSPSLWPDLPPIGTPLPHVKIYLLDENKQPVPMEGIGELYIGGVCLAEGYINRPDLTSERFITSNQGERLYRTGDLVKQNSELLEFKGRKDHQVKIHGHRIEIAEVEAAISRHPDVIDVTVIADRGVNDVLRLVAYVVSSMDKNDPTTASSQLMLGREFSPPWRDQVEMSLPKFMVPTVWIRLSQLPLTTNGKVDRTSLPPVPNMRPPLNCNWVRPHNPAQSSITTIWEEVLQLQEICIDDNFFDLGGTSLLVATVAQKIRDEMGMNVSLVDLYECSTIRQLALLLEQRSSSASQWTNPTFDSSQTRSQMLQETNCAIAVVGLSCRFPGASDPQSFWNNLVGGIESVSFFDAVSPERQAGFVPAAGILPEIEWFDANFFGYSRHEARLLDPQHRLFLECAWEALEDAACEPQSFPGKIGVFGGTGPSTYLINNLHSASWRSDRSLLNSSAEVAMLIATDKDFLTSRVSYLLDLQGPSLNLNAACATSLFAIHYACRSLVNRECDLALSGAACIPVPQLSGHHYELSMPYSPDGHCRPFDDKASGTVFGSGVGVVALKRLSDAIADGDDVYAIVRGSAVNNDGARKVGMAAPSVDGQAKVIGEALMSAGVEPESLVYVEAHGTATIIGDPVEVKALTRAFGSHRVQWCGLGSVKSNLGHLGWAAGMAGFLKAVLILRHGQIPATLHYQRPNPLLELEKTPFFVVSELMELPQTNEPRRVGVSAFGLGGANAHVILEEAPRREMSALEAHRWHIIPISAQNENALIALTERYIRYLETQKVTESAMTLATFAATTALGRRHHRVRHALVVSNHEDLLKQMKGFAALPPAKRNFVSHRTNHRIVGLFGGYGTEYLGMAQALYDCEPIFREALDQFDYLVQKQIGTTMREMLYERGKRGTAITDIVEVHVAIFTVQMAIFQLWQSLGVKFEIVMGHSLGEYAAACAAGVFSLEDGLTIVTMRGRAIRDLSTEGAMAMVAADEARVQAALALMEYRIDIAAVNSDANTIISGQTYDISQACIDLARQGYVVKQLDTSRAGHSELMEPVMAAIEAAFKSVTFQLPKIDLISNLTGKIVTQEVCTPAYWKRHIRETVRFSDGIRVAHEIGGSVFIELSAAPILLGLAQSVLSQHPGPWIPSLRRNRPDDQTFCRAIADVYCAGFDIKWTSVLGDYFWRSHIPTYPFQREKFWINPGKSKDAFKDSSTPNTTNWQEWVYDVKWEILPFPKRALAVQDSGVWLIFEDTLGVGRTLSSTELQPKGFPCICIRQGDEYTWVDAQTVILNPCDEDHLDRLIEDTGRCVQGVIQLWGIDIPNPDVTQDEDIISSLRPVIASTLNLVKGLIRHNQTADIALWLVSRGAYQILPTDPVHPMQTPLGGLGRVISMEFPDLHCVRLDLAGTEPPEISLLANLLFLNPKDSDIAVRDRKVYTARLKRSQPPQTVPILRRDATYLIVGGLGGLGLWAARSLVARGAKHLVLAGRHQPSADALQIIRELVEQGVDVVVKGLDVAKRNQVEQLFQENHHCDRPLAGILHCAGTLDDALLTNLTWEKFKTVLSPKMQGAWNLHAVALAHGVELDLFVFYSSATAILGNYGQGNYAAANAFLDGLAHHRHAQGLKSTSINWGVWSGIGGVSLRVELLSQLKARGMGSITPQAGADALQHYLANSSAQVAILPNYWSDFLLLHNLSKVPLFSYLINQQTQLDDVVDFQTNLMNTPPELRRALVVDYLLTTISQFIGGCAIIEDDLIAEMGLDSLSLIQLRNSLLSEFQCALPPNLLLEYPTVRQIADYLLENVLTFEAPFSNQSKPVLAEHREFKEEIQYPDSSFPLSIQQKRWLSLIRNVRYGQRIVPIVFYAHLDRTALYEALRLVVARHELLRYRYPVGQIERLSVEEVLPPERQFFEDIKLFSLEESAQIIAERVQQMRRELPDPYEQPSWTIRCLDLATEKFVLLVGAQHLEFDGSGLSVFVNEIREVYQALRTSTCLPTLPKVVQYHEYTKWQQDYMRSRLIEDRAFFEGLFAGVADKTVLLGTGDSNQSTVACHSRRYTPPSPLAEWSRVQQVAIQLAISPFALLLSSYAKLLSKITQSPIVVISIIRSGRVERQFARTIGPFTMPFPIPIFVNVNSPRELAKQCDRTLNYLNARAHYPSTDLIEAVPLFKGLPNDTYFSDAGINFQNYRREETSGQPPVEIIEVLGQVEHPEFSQCDFGDLRRIPGLHLVASVNQDSLLVHYWYHTQRFSQGTIENWASEHFQLMSHLLTDAEMQSSTNTCNL